MICESSYDGFGGGGRLRLLYGVILFGRMRVLWLVICMFVVMLLLLLDWKVCGMKVSVMLEEKEKVSYVLF